MLDSMEVLIFPRYQTSDNICLQVSKMEEYTKVMPDYMPVGWFLAMLTKCGYSVTKSNHFCIPISMMITGRARLSAKRKAVLEIQDEVRLLASYLLMCYTMCTSLLRFNVCHCSAKCILGLVL